MLEAEYDLPDREVRKWAMLTHLGGLASLALFPFAGVVIPLIVWLAKRDNDPYIDEQGRESVNFQISMFLYWIVMCAAVLLLKVILIGHLLIWLPILITIAQAGGCVVGAIRAYDGERFRYPLILRFL